MSDEAKDLISRLLVLDPAERLSAKEACACFPSALPLLTKIWLGCRAVDGRCCLSFEAGDMQLPSVAMLLPGVVFTEWASLCMSGAHQVLAHPWFRTASSSYLGDSTTDRLRALTGKQR